MDKIDELISNLIIRQCMYIEAYQSLDDIGNTEEKFKEAQSALRAEFDALQSELAALKEAQRWISISEQPEPSKSYWVTNGIMVCEGFYSAGEFLNSFGHDLPFVVTHYMNKQKPPQPPEAE